MAIVISSSSLIQGNRISGAETGVLIGSTAPGNRVIDNTFTGNGVGIRVDAPFLDEVDRTLISDNAFLRNRAAGVLFEATGVINRAGATIERNRFVGNGFAPAGLTDHLGNPVADGLHIAVPAGGTVLVADNATRHNASYGIFAVPGTVRDGGGNSSAGDPNGCLGVICR